MGKFQSRLHHAPRADSRKCVRIDNGPPIRLSNEDAHLVICREDAEYCPKAVFKKYRKEHPEHPARHRINSQNRIVADDRPADR